MKDALKSKAILAQIFCFLDHKRCCLAFILLGLCLAIEMTVTLHAQIANIRKYWANDITVTACFSSWHHLKKIATIITIIIEILKSPPLLLMSLPMLPLLLKS